ncbi:hypothetical protein CDA63_18755 [Hymenobacter amundsenii]|uniref:Uncharacterized protein n=1 Tax=Hymenobacter amundsenii TaxID=2006685 RepID=A0A246FGA0_9BACT|nr:PcfJ domain-containing protein [Hymenobacter amundsenii]OWP61557.1 hypothetical protein CDA63_18755 [Hymenobacter amundsenii]
MSNRHKTLSAQALAAQRAVAVLAYRFAGRKWPLVRQIQYLYTCASVADVHAVLEPASVPALLYVQCLHGRSEKERSRAHAALQALVGCQTDILNRPELVPAVAAICRLYYYRRRELSDWQPQRRNAYRQLYSLVRHLFDEFGDVPCWVVEAWATGQLTQHGLDLARLTVHLGSGQALRTFAGLPVPLTRRLEHALRQAPCEYSFVQALRYAQLADLGALALLEPLLATRLGQETGPDDAFWLTVVAFFRDAPMVDPWQLGPVCDWIHQRRTVGTDGEPPQPGFSLKGRRMDSVLRLTTRWHRRTHRARTYWGYGLSLATTWAGLPIADFEAHGTVWVLITQVLGYGQLLEEGSTQKHCVSSYAYSCLRGRCGIFSLRLHGARALTVEVRPNRQIVQIRGRENRAATEQERYWLTQWASKAGLSFLPGA